MTTESDHVKAKLKRGGRPRRSWCDHYASEVARGRGVGDVAREFKVSYVAVWKACKRRGVTVVQSDGDTQ